MKPVRKYHICWQNGWSFKIGFDLIFLKIRPHIFHGLISFIISNTSFHGFNIVFGTSHIKCVLTKCCGF